VFLDFLSWLTQQTETNIVSTEAGQTLVAAVSGFETGVAEAAAKYGETLKNIANELSALMVERKKLFEQGTHTSDIEQAIKNLLAVTLSPYWLNAVFSPDMRSRWMS
jgi:hypothetical protein